MDAVRRAQWLLRGQSPEAVALFMMVSGLLYLALALRHWEHSPEHGLFIGSAAIAQISWTLAYARIRSRRLQLLGIGIAGGLILVWSLSLLFPISPDGGREALDILGATATILQTFVVAGLLGRIANHPHRLIGASSWQSFGLVVAITLAFGGVLHGLGLPIVSAEGHHHQDVVAAASPSDSTSTSDIVELVVAGIPQRLTGDDEIPITGDILAQIVIGPGTTSQRYGRTLDLRLYRSSASVQPVDDASVKLSAQMRYMDHGTFRVVAVQSGDGHYLLPLKFPMPGEWQLEVEVMVPGQSPATTMLNVDLLN